MDLGGGEVAIDRGSHSSLDQTRVWSLQSRFISRLHKQPSDVSKPLVNPVEPAFASPKVNPAALYARPQVVAFNGKSAWIFPGVLLPQFVDRLTQAGITSRPAGESQNSPPCAKQSRSTKPEQLSSGNRIVSGRIGKQPAKHAGPSNLKSLSNAEERNLKKKDRPEIRFGCPFCKLTPIRYLRVRGRNRSPCTDPPGLEFDHIK
jgi:hypothetical protein